MTGPTPRQAEVLQYLRSFIAEHGYAPSMTEIGDHFGIRSKNAVNDHLVALEKKGLIEREPFKSRAIRIVGEGLERYTTEQLQQEIERRGAAEREEGQPQP